MTMTSTAKKVHSFSIKYIFFDESHQTELSFFVDGSNILSFERNGVKLTTRWNVDELVIWLKQFVSNMSEDPYPVDIFGEYAADKDINARDFDSDDDEEFDAYYDRIDKWNLRHRWHTASGGAILADLYFQLAGDYMEISWNNLEPEEGVSFDYKLGGISIPLKQFNREMDLFLKEYSTHWADKR